jgi:hypothetical protein
MVTIGIVAVAVWLVAAPGLLDFGSATGAVSVVAGVVAIWARVAQKAGEETAIIFVAVGVGLVVTGAAFSAGAARMSDLVAGVVLVALGFKSTDEPVHKKGESHGSLES